MSCGTSQGGKDNVHDWNRKSKTAEETIKARLVMVGQPSISGHICVGYR